MNPAGVIGVAERVAGAVNARPFAVPDGKDAALVSCSSKDELARVRDSWLKKKLALSDSDSDLDKSIKDICEKVKADKQKDRVTFYYLLAEKHGKLKDLHKKK